MKMKTIVMNESMILEYCKQVGEVMSISNALSSISEDLSSYCDGKARVPKEIVANNLKTLEMGYKAMEVALNHFQSCMEATETPEEEHDYEETEEIEEVITIQDVVPVYGSDAQKLNKQVISRIETALNHDKHKIDGFKKHAMEFGKAEKTGQEFYEFLSIHMDQDVIDGIILDFAKLLAIDERRLSLLEAYEKAKRHNAIAESRILESPPTSPARLSSRALPLQEKRTSPAVPVFNDFPPELVPETINHLVFIIHGIGQHIDFQDGEMKSWDGAAGLEGGNHSFREIFRTLIDTQFKEIPLSLELQSIEWHEELHTPTGVDDIFDMICPAAATGLREFNKTTLMDVLYYMSPTYGQIIIDKVTEQLNSKYEIFLKERPGWQGHVTIFAHSLGSVIAYDILTHRGGEKAKNGVIFPELNFEVENLIAAGSPVPIMVLSRGDLQIKDGNFQSGLKMPRCNHYFNLYHPVDPIAYRVEPLIKPEMRSTPSVELPVANSVKDMSFVQLQEFYGRLTTPLHGISRIDHVLKRWKREGMMALAKAAASHSSYWETEDVVLFTLLQICRPVTERLHSYTRAERPLPLLGRGNQPLTPMTKVLTTGSAVVRDGCSGFWYEKVFILTDERIFVNGSIDELTCRKRGSIALSHTTYAEYGEDPFTLSLKSDGVVHLLKARTTEVRDEWIKDINRTVSSITPGSVHIRRASSSLQLPTDVSIDYFGSIRTGTLSKKGESSWMDGWKNRWFVLHENRLDFYETPPNLVPCNQFRVTGSSVHSYSQGYLFRILSQTGTSREFRVKDKAAFDLWIKALSKIDQVEMVFCDDVVEGSQSAVVILADAANRDSMSAKVSVQGHQVLLDETKGTQYAAFVIHVKTASGNSVVLRRFSEFKKLHQKLKSLFPDDKMPELPHSRLWNKFDPIYLKRKAVNLQAYLEKVSALCTENRGFPVLMKFLSDEVL